MAKADPINGIPSAHQQGVYALAIQADTGSDDAVTAIDVDQFANLIGGGYQAGTYSPLGARSTILQGRSEWEYIGEEDRN